MSQALIRFQGGSLDLSGISSAGERRLSAVLEDEERGQRGGEDGGPRRRFRLED